MNLLYLFFFYNIFIKNYIEKTAILFKIIHLFIINTKKVENYFISHIFYLIYSQMVIHNVFFARNLKDLNINIIIMIHINATVIIF